MLAALLLRPGRIVIDEVAEPEPAPGEVRIAVGGVGLCGSDMSVFSGKWTAPAYPWVMGHEAFGTIETVGASVDRARVGETVVIEPNISCDACAECARGRTSACTDRRAVGMNRPGALAEKLVVPASRAWRVQPRDPRDLVCVEPLAVVETALRRLPTPLPAEALVIGAGAQGSLMTLSLQRRSVHVSVVDVNPARAAFVAETLGATVVADDDRRYPFVVDTTGAPAAMAEAIRHAEVRATILELGLDRQPLGLVAETLVRRQLSLQGSLTYDHPDDFAWTVSLIDEGTVSPGRVISTEYPLADAQRAFEASREAPGKTWISVGVGT
jgi:alcohol dehydrogenase/L-iditol 2-dehydrogenase